ncbi:hypothetical protein FIBSPDRAFT_699531, partial [Athelia psychrophila]
LDISGAFPNTVIPMLVHNMREKGIPVELTDAIMRMNTGRTTQLKFDGFTSAPIPVLSGLDQGNPLSMVLYTFYAADVLEPEPEPEETIEDEMGSAFVDDTAILA